jgi:pyruvate kinase
VKRRTKIVATLGPTTSTEETIRELVRTGVDVARLNFSHGEHEGHLKNARFVRQAAESLGRNVAVMQDIQGPEIRIGEVVGDTELVEGNRVVIAPGDFLGDAGQLSISYEQIAQDIEPGHQVLIDDGLLELKVEEIENGELVCEVVTGGPISSHKGMNFPDSSLSIEVLTPKDLEDLRFGI